MRLLNFLRRRKHQQEMNDEMRFHIDMETADLVRAGLSPEEARRRALVRFGGVRRFQEEGHEVRTGTWLLDVLRDFRYSARSLWHARGYAAVIVLTLSLGIAANTSIFSVANGILFKRLPYRDPSRLMVLWDGLDWIGVPEAWITGSEVLRLRRETRLFDGFAALRPATATLDATGGSEPEQVPLLSVSANFFQILGAGPALGRGFANGEDALGAPRLVVLSHKVWHQRFLADSAIIGKSILLDGQATRVIGVLPPSFHFSPQSSLGSASEVDAFVPLVDTLALLPRGNHSLGVLARVRADVSVASAERELANLSRRVDEEQYGQHGFKFVPVLLQDRITREVRPALVALLAAVGLLIAIMCANLAVLALTRAGRRERELTVRRAIGAGTGRIARQIFVETVLLSLLSGVIGIVAGAWGVRGLLALAPAGLPRRDEITIDLRVLGLTLLLAIAVGIALALAPVLRSARTDIATVLRERSPSRLGGRVRRGFVLAQLALSMVLLASTGLLLRSFMSLTRVDAGFDGAHVLVVELLAGRARYAAGQPVADAFARYTDAIRALPGVTAVGASSATPLSAGADQSGVRFPNSPTNNGIPEHDGFLGDVAPATPGYFAAMGIALVDGREFQAGDRGQGAKVAIIDDLAAARFYPRGGALGQPIMIDGDTLRVVGIVHHVRMYSLEEVGREQVYVPHNYRPYRDLAIAVRANGNAVGLTSIVRQAIRAVDAGQPVANVWTMSQAVRDSLAQRRLVLTLVAGFALTAALLVALGIYGVTASFVTDRTRELGIRIALGAEPGRVLAQVLAEPVRLVAIGLALGLVGTIVSRRVLGKLVFGVSPDDPLTLGIVAASLLLVALIAGYLPARRATGVDPMVTLRSD